MLGDLIRVCHVISCHVVARPLLPHVFLEAAVPTTFGLRFARVLAPLTSPSLLPS